MTLRVVLMGVAGSGKTAVGTALAARLGLSWVDADDLHPPANVARMAAGIPLTDADRWPWLDAVAEALRTRAPVVAGCSALRRAYRDRLRAGAGGPVRFVHLAGDPATIAARLAGRTGHFMPPSLLDSQLALLEPPGPEEALTLDIAENPETLAARIARALAEPAP